MTTDIVVSNDEAIRESRVPAFDNEDKVRYLSYRAVGFTKIESCHLAEIEVTDVAKWIRDDERFKDFEGRNLRELQKTAAADIVENEFKRNLTMLLRKDARLIQKSMQAVVDPRTQKPIDGIELLTDREWSYLQAIRKYYTPDQLLKLSQALEPEKHQDNKVVVLSFDGRPVELPDINDIEGFSLEVVDGNSNND